MSELQHEDEIQEQRTSPRESLELALQGSPEELAGALDELHGADIAEGLLDLQDRDVWQVFSSLDNAQRAELLTHAEDTVREQLLEQLAPRQIAAIVEYMAPDDVVDLLALSGNDVAERVLRNVAFDRAKDLRRLAAYPPESAGGLMTTDFLVVGLGTRIGDAIKLLKQEALESDTGGGLFVVDGRRQPVGYVSDRKLLKSSIHDVVDDVMKDPVTVPVDMDQEEVAQRILKYGLRELAVVDRTGVIVGVVHGDDAQDVLEDEASEDLLKIVGTSAEQQTRLPVYRRVRARLPLQGLTVVGGLVTAWIIERVMGGSTREADLLRFVPIIIGLAGNVGIQASTILVRAFATGEVEADREVSVLGSETLVGLVIGLLCGLATAGAVLVGEGGQDPRFSLAIGVAIASAVTWAAFLGCGVPMVCRRVGIDPAIVAGPFLITVSDISGTALYLAVAGMVVGV